MKFNVFNLVKLIKGTGKTVHKSVKSSLGFMDDILEKEYIIGGIENVKEASGKVIEKSGEIYANTKMKLEDLQEDTLEEE